MRRGREWNLLNKRAHQERGFGQRRSVQRIYVVQFPTGEGVYDNVGDLFAGIAL